MLLFSENKTMICYVFVCLFAINFSSAVVTVPTLKLLDGRDIPVIALGTWLGNNTKNITRAKPRADASVQINVFFLTYNTDCSQHGRVEPTGHEVEDAVTWALDAGYRHIDTAFAYRIEDQVGRALTAKFDQGLKREDVFVTTKLWNDRHAREAVVPALRESLQKLQLEYVDLYLIHWPLGQFSNLTYDYTDYVDTWRGMVEAKSLGLTKSIGVSNFNQQQIDRLVEEVLETPAVLQVEINLNLQQPELLSYCKQKGIIVMAYTPFGSLFPGRAKPDSPPPRVDAPKLVEIAQKYGKTVPQIVLRYLVELGVIPIPKSLTKSRLEQNIDIFDFTLNQEEKDLLKSYDKGYRTIPQLKWIDHPYFPFEKKSKD